MKFSFNGISDKKVKEELFSFFQQDRHYNDGTILGSMSTSPKNIAKEMHSLFLEANLGNPGLYPGTGEVQERVISMLCNLMALDIKTPDGKNCGGHILSGGTEANITALWLYRNQNKGNELIFPESAHFSLYKAADILGLRPRVAKLDSEFKMDTENFKELCTKNTSAIVAIAGTTELGQIDPIREVGEYAFDRGIPLHVDAAFGGFVLPFLDKIEEPFDFRVSGVTSIGVDPHKMGLSTTPAGALLLRNSEIQKGIAVKSPYLTSEKNMTLSGTRNSASVAAAYAVMRSLGREGYRKIVKDCLDNTNYLVSEMKKIGFKHVINPIINVAAFYCENPEIIIEKMRLMNWYLSKATHPNSLRFVIMPHIRRTHITNMVTDLKNVLREI